MPDREAVDRSEKGPLDLEVGDVLEHWHTRLRLHVTGFTENGRVLVDGVEGGRIDGLNPGTLMDCYFKIGQTL